MRQAPATELVGYSEKLVPTSGPDETAFEPGGQEADQSALPGLSTSGRVTRAESRRRDATRTSDRLPRLGTGCIHLGPQHGDLLGLPTNIITPLPGPPPTTRLRILQPEAPSNFPM